MRSSGLYNIGYYNLMLRQNSKHAKRISGIRWNFIRDMAPRVVLDYGCGVGWFAAFAPDGIVVDTFDLGEAPVSGIRHMKYDMVTLWDVFEHMEDHQLLKEVLGAAGYVALSVPVLPAGQNLFKWKHFKPGEHLYQFTPESLEAIFNDWGFEKVKEGWPEVICGIREDIYSVVYRNVLKQDRSCDDEKDCVQSAVFAR